MNTRTFLIRLVAASIALCLTACWTPAGKGRKANAGYKAAAPVIAALEKFHQERGHYPEDLSELVPQLLAEPKAFRRFGYRTEHGGYELMFTYTGPGMNHCWYDSKTKLWHAHGYY